MPDASILIVEDEAIVAGDLAKKLRRLGYSVAGITGFGEKAVSLAQELQPNLVLMDVRLSGSMDGIDAAERIRRECSVPVIYLTSYSDRATVERAKITEPFGFILKPFEERELESHIEMALYKHRAELRLRESEQKWATILASIGDAVIATDMAGRVIFMNAVAEDLTGWTTSEAVNQPVQTVFHIISETSRQTMEDPVSKVLESGMVVGLANHTLLVRKDGREAPIDDSGAPIIDRQGKTTGVVLVFRDITERRRAEESLRKSEEWLRVTLGSIGDAVIASDAKGNVTFLNPVAASLTGWSPEEAQGQLFGRVFRVVNELTQEPGEDLVKWVLRENRIVELANHTALISKTGRVVPVEDSAAPITDIDGKPAGVVVVFHDVTEKRRAEEALRESHREFAAIFERSIVGKAQVDPASGRFVRVNQALADLTGYSIEELCRMTFTELTHPDDRQQDLEIFESVRMGRADKWQNEKRYVRKDGSDVWVNVAGNSIRHDDGRPAHTIAVIQDIAARRQAEQQLKELNTVLEQRIAERTAEAENRALQLRRLMTDLTLAEQRERQHLSQVLHDGLQQILVGAKYQLAQVAHSQNIDQAVSQVEDLISDAIETSRSLTAELSPPILVRDDLVSALEWLARWMRDKHGLDIDLIAHKKIEPLTRAALLLLFQAARELLFNVVKHAEVRKARIEVDQLDGRIQMIIEDEGAGFDVNQLGANKERSGGIGLLTVRERISYIGGSVEIDSMPGRGSRFKLIVPLALTREETISQSLGEQSHVSVLTSPQSMPIRDDRNIRIVLVDDHMVVRQGLAGLLRCEPDFEIAGEASDGESAIILAQQIQPDVVLMDISMPSMNGIQATRIINQKYPEIRIIGLSMFEKGEQETAMREAGAVEYLAKSGPSEDLIRAIRACIGKGQFRTPGSAQA
jgi:PAS domain S-box-containing protein